MDTKNRIEVAKANLKRAEQTKTIKETQKTEAEKQQAEVVLKMAEQGVTPETIQDEIAKLGMEIVDGVTKVEGLLPNA